jgi:hypothetical protein
LETRTQGGEDEKEKEEERLGIHSWWCGGFHGMGYIGTGVRGYKTTRLQGWLHAGRSAGVQGGCTAHSTYTVALEMDFSGLLMFLGAPGPLLCLVLGAWCSCLEESCWLIAAGEVARMDGQGTRC